MSEVRVWHKGTLIDFFRIVAVEPRAWRFKDSSMVKHIEFPRAVSPDVEWEVPRFEVDFARERDTSAAWLAAREARRPQPDLDLTTLEGVDVLGYNTADPSKRIARIAEIDLPKPVRLTYLTGGELLRPKKRGRWDARSSFVTAFLCVWWFFIGWFCRGL